MSRPNYAHRHNTGVIEYIDTPAAPPSLLRGAFYACIGTVLLIAGIGAVSVLVIALKLVLSKL